jgi:hypothetical protein
MGSAATHPKEIHGPFKRGWIIAHSQISFFTLNSIKE